MFPTLQDRQDRRSSTAPTGRSLLAMLSLVSLASLASVESDAALPTARSGHASVFDPVRNQILVLGGHDDLGARFDDVWSLPGDDPLSGVEIFPAGSAPSPRSLHSAIYDPLRDRVVIFGGYGSSYLNDTWVLDLSGTPAWSPLVAAGIPPTPRAWHTAIYDPVRDRMIVYGQAMGAPSSDLWELSFSGTPTWTPLTAAGPQPQPRIRHSAIYDPVQDRMLIYGGYHSVLTGEIWELSLTGTMTWALVHAVTPPRDGPGGRELHSAIYDPVAHRMLVYAGRNVDYSLGDVWELKLSGTEAWIDGTAEFGEPGTRYGHTAIYRSTSPGMVVFGGRWPQIPLLDLPLDEATTSVPMAVGLGLAIHGLHPNPMRSSGGVMSFSLVDDQPATIDLIDVTGRRVWTREVGAFGAGRHTVAMPNDRAHKPGVYFLRLSSGSRSVTTKAVFTD